MVILNISGTEQVKGMLDIVVDIGRPAFKIENGKSLDSKFLNQDFQRCNGGNGEEGKSSEFNSTNDFFEQQMMGQWT